MSHLDTLFLKQLAANSAHYRDPLQLLPWKSLSYNEFWLPKTALSLVGIEEFERQPELVQRRLSHYEFIHFLNAGLWLEGLFIARLGNALRGARSHAEYVYNLHEIREEAGHSLMFLQLMEVSGLHLPLNSFRRPWLADYVGRRVPQNTLLFWMAMVIGEDIPDRVNRYIRNHSEGINTLILEMSRFHCIDEARHLARSRRTFEQNLAQAGFATRTAITLAAHLLLRQFLRTFFLPSSTVYELAGLKPGQYWRDLARKNPKRQEYIAQIIRPTLQSLQRHGLQVKLPRL